MTVKPQTLIFDFDGTIANSVEVFVDIARKISGTNTKIEVEELRSLRGLIRFGQRVGAPYWQFPLAFKKVRSMVDKHIGEIEPFDGMAGAIKQLHAGGHRLFIVSTNATKTIERFLVINGLDEYFSGVYGSRQLVKSKVRSLRALVRREKLASKACVFIGDEPRDMEASGAIGMPCVAVSWGFVSADNLRRLNPAALANNPSELAEIIKLLQLS